MARPGPLTGTRHRIPVRVRHYWKLLAVCAAFVVTLTVVIGAERIRPYVTSPIADGGNDIVVDIAGGRDLFDAAAAHTVSVTFDQADYERMLDTYTASGQKDWIEANITIDGAYVPSVGLRLKGNSTLAGLSRAGQPIGPQPGWRRTGRGRIRRWWWDSGGPRRRRAEGGGTREFTVAHQLR